MLFVSRSAQTAQVIAGPNESQLHNISLVNATFAVRQMLNSILSDQREFLTESGKQTLASEILIPIFAQIKEA